MPRDDRRRGIFGLLATAAVVAAASGRRAQAAGEANAFSLAAIEAERARKGQPWHEFLRVESLSMGLYALGKGSEDKQTPHQQDEVYYVTRGRAVLEVEGKGHPAEAGSILFVPARAKHRFRDITEDLTTLVFFAPAETE